MESGKIHPPKKEYVSMAHRLETPQELNLRLRESAEKVGKPEEDEISALVDFKQNVFNFIKHFNISFQRVESDREDKKTVKGGFTKRAVQKHPFLGVKGLRLVRDELSDGIFLKEGQTELYRQLLYKKLVEETVEMIEAMNMNKRVEEVGGVLEVFSTILAVQGINEDFIESKRQMRELELQRINGKKRRKLSKT